MSDVPLPLALQRIDHEYLLFGVAGLICLAAFVSLILVPAVSSYGRLWEKAAAGVLSLFVLAALVVAGVVVGLAIVVNYNEIVEFLHVK
jgi:NADH:ubiquinone oxidoreductase subunit K